MLWKSFHWLIFMQSSCILFAVFFSLSLLNDGFVFIFDEITTFPLQSLKSTIMMKNILRGIEKKKEKNYVEFIWYFFLSLASIDFRFFSRLAFFNKWYFSSIKFPHQRITRLYGVACLHLIFFSSAISPLPLSSSSFDFLCIYLDAMKISQPSREMDKVLEREWVYIWADCLLHTKRQPTAI